MKDDHKIILKLFYWTSERLQLVQMWHNGAVYLYWPSAIYYLKKNCTLLFYWYTQTARSYLLVDKTDFCKLPYCTIC